MLLEELEMTWIQLDVLEVTRAADQAPVQEENLFLPEASTKPQVLGSPKTVSRYQGPRFRGAS